MPRDKEKRRSHVLQVVVPTDMLNQWARAAEQSGLCLSEWVRLRCNGSVLEAIPPSKVA